MVKPQIDPDMGFQMTFFAGCIGTSGGFLGLKEVKADVPDVWKSVRFQTELNFSIRTHGESVAISHVKHPFYTFVLLPPVSCQISMDCSRVHATTP